MKNKKVNINEDALVELIYNITERTINERIEKGELKKVIAPKKTTKVQVTESQLAELVKTGRVLNVKKKSVNESMNNLDWGKSTDERNANLDKYHSLETDTEKKGFAKNLKGQEDLDEAIPLKPKLIPENGDEEIERSVALEKLFTAPEGYQPINSLEDLISQAIEISRKYDFGSEEIGRAAAHIARRFDLKKHN